MVVVGKAVDGAARRRGRRRVGSEKRMVNCLRYEK
jgi:hypothetical protein